jgi:UDP-N-acetylmuramoyl-L-alanyl-D-glutamate--2,6-diaminopimelate ligase
MKLSELSSVLSMSQIQGNAQIEFTGVQADSRKITNGDLFICVSGLVSDGHRYASSAIQNGAVALVVEQFLNLPVPQLRVKDSRHAMAIIAAHVYQYPSIRMKVIGVTGTNGKTTTTYLIEHILREAKFTTGMMGTIDMKIGNQTFEMQRTTLEAIDLQYYLKQMVDQSTDFCVMEVSSHALELGRVKGVHFRSAVFTNLTQDHLDFHHTMDQYQAAKGLLFSRLGNSVGSAPFDQQHAILNMDDSASNDYRRMTAAHVITYGVDQACDIRADQIHIHSQGTQFHLQTFAGHIDIHMKLVGKFNVYNALAAIATTLAEGISLECIQQALEKVPPVRGRMEIVSREQDPFLVLVDYAHTPDGLENALSTIREFAQAKVITVFGCGGDRDKTKRPLMAKVAAKYSDVVWVTSDNPRTENPEQILIEIEQGLREISYPDSQYELEVDRKMAIHKAIQIAQPHDVILIAGKGHETYQEINGLKTDFDDRAIAQTILRRRVQ